MPQQMPHYPRFSGEGRGPVAAPKLAEVATRYPNHLDWAPAFAGEALRIDAAIRR